MYKHSAKFMAFHSDMERHKLCRILSNLFVFFLDCVTKRNFAPH